EALDANRAISQFQVDQWGAQQGFPSGRAYSITQTPDGYLWIGTENGLVRFDGVSFRRFERPGANEEPFGPVLGLATDIDGNLWLRLEQPRVLRYREGIFQDVLSDHVTTENSINTICRGTDGKALFSGHANDVLRYNHGKFVPLVSKAETYAALVLSMAE